MRRSHSIFPIVKFGVLFFSALAICTVNGVAWGQKALKVGEKYSIHIDSEGVSDVGMMITPKGQKYVIV